MVEYKVFVPLVRETDRQAHFETAWQSLRDKVTGEFGAFSERDNVEGKFGPSKCFVIAGRDSDGKLKRVVEFVKTQFDQTNVYVSICQAEIL